MNGRPERKRLTRRIEAEKRASSGITLTLKQARTLRRLLRDYQTHLESAINGLIVPGTNAGMNADDNALLADLRRQWREAEDIQLIFEGRSRR